MKYRTAIIGMILGFSFLVFFSYQAGTTLQFGLAFFSVYFIIAFAHTRTRAELGPPIHGIFHYGPLQFFIAMVGSRKLESQTLTAAAPFWTLHETVQKPSDAVYARKLQTGRSVWYGYPQAWESHYVLGRCRYFYNLLDVSPIQLQMGRHQ